MANGFQITTYVLYGLVCVGGSVLNGMTILVLVRDKELRKNMASLRWLMCGEAFCATWMCSVVVPLMTMNHIVGEAPPFTTIPWLCRLLALGQETQTAVIWYQAAIALTRVAALMAHNDWYRRYVRNRWTTIVLTVLPWMFPLSTALLGSGLKAYRIVALPGSGICSNIPYDQSREGSANFLVFLQVDTMINLWFPMCVCMSCYVAIYTRKLWQQIKNKTKTSPATIQTALNPTTNGSSQQPAINAAQPVPAASLENPIASAQPAVVNMNAKRYKKIKLVALNFMATVLFGLPPGLLYAFGYYNDVLIHAPVVIELMNLLTFVVFPVNPIIFMVVSTDFRRAYKKLIRC